MFNPSPVPQETPIELADVVRRFAPAYLSQFGPVMPSQRRAISDITACCTRELGGRLYQCEGCTETFWRFHCCRNRSCPKCQGTRTAQWLEQREAELLPCEYFHVVATVPKELHPLFLHHQKILYGLLMKIAAQAVKELCAQKRHLGALPGILSVLHTWNGQLGFHPHVHMLITGGGIADDGEHFERTRNSFLVPVKALSRKIAALFRDTLQDKHPELFAQVPARVWKQEWVSFSKPYGQGNDAVLKYLSRYVFRTALSNARILGMDETHVRFRFKNRKTEEWQILRLPGVEFLRRFLLHVLPRGFHKVRYYGLWHPSRRKLAQSVWLLLLLDQSPFEGKPVKLTELLEAMSRFAEPEENVAEDATHSPRADLPCCPHCGSQHTKLLMEWPRHSVP